MSDGPTGARAHRTPNRALSGSGRTGASQVRANARTSGRDTGLSPELRNGSPYRAPEGETVMFLSRIRREKKKRWDLGSGLQRRKTPSKADSVYRSLENVQLACPMPCFICTDLEPNTKVCMSHETQKGHHNRVELSGFGQDIEKSVPSSQGQRTGGQVAHHFDHSFARDSVDTVHFVVGPHLRKELF